MVNQYEFSPFLFNEELLTYCQERGIVVTAYSPMTQTLKFGDETVVEVAKKHSVTPAKVLLRWALQHGVVIIPKSTNEGRIGENLDLFGWTLSDDEMRQLSAATKPQVAGDAGPGGLAVSGDCSVP